MGITEFINNLWKRKPAVKKQNKFSDNVQFLQNKQRYEYNTTGVISKFNYDELTMYYFAPHLGQPRNVNLGLVREFAKSHWVRMCTQIILNAVRSAKVEIVPIDEEEDVKNKKVMEQIKYFYDYPNSNTDNITDVNEKLAKDYLEIGEASLIKIFKSDVHEKKSFTFKYKNWNVDGETPVIKSFVTRTKELKIPILEGGLLEIRAGDAASFLKQPDEYGNYSRTEPCYFQYNWKRRGGAKPRPFFFREVAWMINSISTYDIYGLSPILSIMLVLETLAAGTRSNKKIFENGSVPDAVVSLMTDNPDEVKQFTDFLKDRFKNNPHKVLVLGSDHKFTQLNLNNRDMEWLDGQKFYQKLVMAMFNVTPDEVGYTEDTGGRAVSQGQSRVFVREAIKPILKKLEDLHNKFVIPEFYPTGVIPEVKLKLFFEDEFEKNIERQNDIMDLDKGIITINEVRTKRGLTEVSWGDEPMNKAQSMNDLYLRDKLNSRMVEDNKKKSLKKKFESVTVEALKTLSIRELNYLIDNSSGEVRDEAVNVLKEINDRVSGKVTKVEDLNYNSLEKHVDEVFNEVLEGFKTEMVKHKTDLMNGNLSPVLAAMSIPLALIVFNSEKSLSKQVEPFVKTGVENAEKETNMNLLFNTDVESLSKKYAQDVINGYSLPNGSYWGGLKSVSEELSKRVADVLSEGVEQGKSLSWMRDQIIDQTNFSKSHALMIARNESNRIMQESQFESLKSNGFKGKKKFLAQIDNRTSDICKRMNGQVVPFDADFVDTETGLRSKTAKMHVNCRSTFVLLTGDEK